MLQASHGDDYFVAMFGGLHVDTSALKTLGDILEDSEWTKALTKARVASPGTADSFLKASHVTRTHQISEQVVSTFFRRKPK